MASKKKHGVEHLHLTAAEAARSSVGSAPLGPKPAMRRYRRCRADELIHLDIRRLVRFDRTGH